MHKHIKINLSKVNGNAFAILGSVKKQAKAQKLSETDWKIIQDKAMSRDYNYLLATVMESFTVIF